MERKFVKSWSKEGKIEWGGESNLITSGVLWTNEIRFEIYLEWLINCI